MRLLNDRLSVTSRLTIKKKVRQIMSDYFQQEAPKYDIDIDFLPRINLNYYGRPGKCHWGLTLSWIVWDIRMKWDSNGNPKPIPRKHTTGR